MIDQDIVPKHTTTKKAAGVKVVTVSFPIVELVTSVKELSFFILEVDLVVPCTVHSPAEESTKGEKQVVAKWVQILPRGNFFQISPRLFHNLSHSYLKYIYTCPPQLTSHQFFTTF